tara:strand:+ start:299 stop:592 length:294 start_codon:yes stop_codon:yes gene_type:complete
MDIKRFRIKKHRNGTYLPTIIKKHKSYQSQFDNTFEWLPYIIGNLALIGLVIYSNYSLHNEHGVSFQELLTDTIIYLSLGCVLAYWMQPTKSDDQQN